MAPPDWIASTDINLDDAVITLDAAGLVVGLNEEADRLARDGDPHGKPLDHAFPIRDEFSGQAPTALSRSVVLPSRGGELRAFDLTVVSHGRGRGWTVVLRPAIASGDIEHEAWANLSKTSKEGTGIGDPATGTIGLVSTTFASLYGFTPTEMLGWPLELLFADEAEGLRQTEEHLHSGAVSWEAEHRRKDGSTFPVLMSMTTVRDPLGQARFRALRVEDITGRKAAERREEEQRRLAERVVATVPSVVYFLHPDERGMRFLSNGVASVLGYAVEESPTPGIESVDPRFTPDALHPEDHAAARAHRERLTSLADGEIAIFEYRVRNAVGGWTWFLSRDTVFARDAEGRVETILGTATDVTATKATEAREAYLVRLNDGLRPLVDPEKIQATAVRLLAETIQATRVLYAEMEEDGDTCTVRADHSPEMPSVVGTYRLTDFDPRFPVQFAQGETIAITDVEADAELTEAQRAAFAALSVRANLMVPLVKAGRLTALLSIHSPTPRDWSPDERLLAEETAERTWAAVERARSEADLRESETRLKVALDAAEMGTFVWLPKEDHSECDARLLALYGLRADESIDHARGMALMVLPEDRARHAEAVARALDPSGDGVLRSEYRITRAGDGAERWIATLGQTRFSSPEDGGPRIAVSLTGASEDITERKRAEDRQAFRLRLSETLRTLTDPLAIQAETARLLGEHLGANRVHYGEVAGDHIVIHRGYGNGLPPLVGRFRSLDYGERLVAACRAGQTSVSGDTQVDPTISEAERGMLGATEIRAYVAIPLIRDDAWVAALTVHMVTPRAWTEAEIETIAETAERTWAAVERARAESALRETQTLRDVAASAAKMASWWWDFETGEARVWNDQGLIYGFAVSSAPGQETRTTIETILDRVHPEDRARMEAGVRRTMEEGFDYEEEIRSLNAGDPIWLLVKGKRVNGADGRPTIFAGVSLDITERKAIEEALRVSETRYRALYEGIDQGFCTVEVLLDAEGVAHDYRFLETNPAFERQSGITGVEGRTMREIAPELEAEWYERFGRIALTGGSAQFELRAEALGRDFTVDAFRVGDPTDRRIGILFFDVTERRRAERALRESEERLRVTFETLPLAVGVLDTEGAVVLSNHDMQRFLPTGMIPSRDEARIDRWRAWSPDGRRIDRSGFPGARALRGEDVVPGIEMRYIPEDGAGIWVRTAAMPLRDGEGQITGAVVTVTDIDAFKQAILVPGAIEELYRTLVGDSAQTIWTTDAEGCVVQDSPSWREFTGQTLEQWLGYGWMDAIHPEDRESAARIWSASVGRGLAVDTEYRLWHSESQSWHRTRVRVKPSKQADGAIRGWIGMNTDLGIWTPPPAERG